MKLLETLVKGTARVLRAAYSEEIKVQKNQIVQEFHTIVLGKHKSKNDEPAPPPLRSTYLWL